MKKFISLIMVVAMLMTSVLCVSVNAAQSGVCGDNLTWTLDDNGTLTISGTGEIYEFIGSWASVIVPWRDSGAKNLESDMPWKDQIENITSIIIEEGVTGIGDYAFDGCVNVLSVSIANSVKYIGAYAFGGCQLGGNSYGDPVYIPAGVETIGESAFYGNTLLANIVVDKNNNNYSSEDGVLFDKTKSTLICCPIAKEGNYTIPSSVTFIGTAAFAECYGLNDLYIPSSVHNVSSFAFAEAHIPNIYMTNGTNLFGDKVFSTHLVNPEVSNLYYSGTEQDWNNIHWGRDNNGLNYMNIYYNYVPGTENIVDSIPSTVENNITVILDGNQIEFDVPPQLINDRTMVPMRAIFEALGATVEWNGDTNTVTAYKDDKTIKLTIGDANMYVNDKTVELDSPACVIEDRTLVPVRAISESLDLNVNWNGETNTVDISSASETGINTAPPYDEEYLLEQARKNLELPVRDTITHTIETEFLPALGEWVARIYFYENGEQKAKYTWCLESDQHYGGYSDF